MHIYLFDMDAVLLEPGGYRAALTETINYFSRRMELGDLAPTPSEIDSFEAGGITSEWDIAPIAVVAMAIHGSRPDYNQLAAALSAAWQSNEYPCETADRVLFANTDSAALEIGQHRAARAGLREDWLADSLLQSRDIHRSEVLRIFQQFTLGDDYERAYGLKRTFQGLSTLQVFDRPMLDRSVPLYSAIYTARPSGAPRDVAPLPGYAPEAELGARQVGLESLPIVGFGSFQWLCQALGNGARSESFLKPSPVHGLAAIAAALGGPESEAIFAGEAAVRGEWRPPLAELRRKRGHITVFEDSARSIAGVRQAAALLGENWGFSGIGIAQTGPKRDVLSRAADRVYENLSLAMTAEIGHETQIV
jgi:hypothetical protein